MTASAPIAAIRHPCHASRVTVHPRHELEHLSRVARGAFSHAFMSDTKWRKLFAVLEEDALGLCQMRMKFVDVEQPAVMMLPSIGFSHTPHPYIDTIEFGPVEFRAIEWLEIPAVARLSRPSYVSDREIPQNLAQLEACLGSCGLFPIQRSDESLRIVGYSR